MAGVWAKFHRGEEHAREFERLLTRYTESDPYSITLDFDPKTGWHHFRWNVRVEPPCERFAVLFGDMLSNLRASLDYLVWQLCILSGAELHKFRSFPAAKRPNQWSSALGRELAGIDQTCVDLIDELQPYHRTDRPEIHPLAILDEVNNANKHRVLPATVAGVVEFSTLIGVESIPDGEEFEQFFDETMRHGADLYRVRTASRAQMQMHMNPKPPLRVTFPDALGHPWTNQEMVDWVFNALARFKPAFAG
jgi:hypothetical protein